MELWYDYVADQGAAFRLVFESDLTSDPSVREQVDRVVEESAAAIAEVIREDTGLPDAAVPPARREPGRHGSCRRPQLAVAGLDASPVPKPSTSSPGSPGAGSAASPATKTTTPKELSDRGGQDRRAVRAS